MMLRYQVNCPEPIPDVFSGIEISTETEIQADLEATFILSPLISSKASYNCEAMGHPFSLTEPMDKLFAPS